jgi:hypothetical protein
MKVLSNIYYVYEWYFVDSGKVFYVGKGKGRRYRERKDRNDKFIKYVNKFDCNVRKRYENLTEEQAFQKEIELIAYYKDLGQCSCNLTMGGDNPPIFYGKKHPNRRVVVQLTFEGDFIKQWDCISDVEKELNVSNSLITRCCKGKVNSAGGFLWVYLDEYNPSFMYTLNRKTVAKPIIQYNTNGDFVKEWGSAKEACESLGLRRPGLCSCLKGKYKSSGGFLWKYKGVV